MLVLLQLIWGMYVMCVCVIFKYLLREDWELRHSH